MEVNLRPARGSRPRLRLPDFASEVGAHLAWLCMLAVLAGCSALPPPAPTPFVDRPAPRQSFPATGLDTLGLVAYATSMQGKPYRVAGDSPDNGFDCSGLVYHVYSRFELLLPRNVAAMAATLPTIPLTELQAADLLFFNTQGARYSHVGIYLGEGRFVHAPSPQTGQVIISEINNPYWQGRITGARRPVTLPLASRAE